MTPAFASWSDFFAMGGYALYVWGSAGAFFAFILIEWLQLRARHKAIRNKVLRKVNYESKA